jgi:hypothetical protein
VTCSLTVTTTTALLVFTYDWPVTLLDDADWYHDGAVESDIFSCDKTALLGTSTCTAYTAAAATKGEHCLPLE